MFLQVDGTFWVQLLNFAIFFAVLNVVFLRPVGAAIRKRRAYINSLTADYERYQEQAKTLREEAETIRAHARREAEQHLTKARAEISNATAELTSEYTQRAQSVVEEAHSTVASELKAARANEEQLVKQLADEMVERTVIA